MKRVRYHFVIQSQLSGYLAGLFTLVLRKLCVSFALSAFFCSFFNRYLPASYANPYLTTDNLYHLFPNHFSANFVDYFCVAFILMQQFYYQKYYG